jgi:hypothetical protein
MCFQKVFGKVHKGKGPMASSKATTRYTDLCDLHSLWLLVSLFPLQGLILLKKVPKVELDYSQTVLFQVTAPTHGCRTFHCS